MDGITDHTPMTHLLRERGVFDRHPFVLIDVGCAGGIDDAWRAFGRSLVVHAYDPDIAACEDARARERFDHVAYHAQHVGLPETHPFVVGRREEASKWPNTNIWGRISAGYLAERAQKVMASVAAQMADPSAVIGVDDIVRTEGLSTVDFLKIDVDGSDVEVLESAREVLASRQLLGVGMEVNWFGSANPSEHTFHNTDRHLREAGFTLFGLTVRKYSRTDMPAPFEKETFARTLFGQPYQGDAIYIRDLAADYMAATAAEYPTEKLIKLACIYEVAALPDCAAEVLNSFKSRLAEFGDLEPLLDALTPPLLGEQLSYRKYIAQFKREPELFLPSSAAPPAPSPTQGAAPTASPGLLRGASGRVKRRLHRQYTRARSLREQGMLRSGVAAQARMTFLERAPGPLVRSLAAGLARSRPLAFDAGWHLHVPGDDADQLTLLKRELWEHYRNNGIDESIVFRWYEGLRLHLYLGNDLSLCLYVLGAFEPNEFVFLKRALQPGMVILDGGANEGLFSLYAARRVGSRGSVVAVEPSARELERLKANVALNHLDNVRPFGVALGSGRGEVSFAVAQARHAGMNAIEAQDAGQRTADWAASRVTVPLETIDELVAQSGLHRLDLIKLDIEGAEVDALGGALATIARFRPTILLEVEEERLRTQGRTKAELLDLLTGLDYELWVMDGGSAQLRPARLPLEPEGNAVAAPRGWRPPVLN